MQYVSYKCEGVKNKPDEIRLTVQNDYPTLEGTRALIKSIASLKVMLEAKDRTDEMAASINIFNWTEEDLADLIEYDVANPQEE